MNKRKVNISTAADAEHKRVGARDLPKRKRMVARPFVNTPGVLHIFTDGSCNIKDTTGGWGVKLIWGEGHKLLLGGKFATTNNEMELTAIFEGLKARTRDVKTVVYSDSQYCVNALTVWHQSWRRNGWYTSMGQPVKNKELIENVLALITPNVSLRWVKGHAGHEHNEVVDRLASVGRKEFGTIPEGGSRTHTDDDDSDAIKHDVRGDG